MSTVFKPNSTIFCVFKNFYYYFKKRLVNLVNMYYNLTCKRESTLQRILDYDPLLIIYTPLIVARWFPLRATVLYVTIYDRDRRNAV